MNSQDKTASQASVLIVVDTAAPLQPLFEQALATARRLDLQVQALLVEDHNLVRLAELPFATEVDRYSGVARRIERGQIDRAMRRQTQRAQAMLADLARQHSVSVAATTVRGQYLSEALAAALKANIAFLYRQGYRRLQGSGSRAALVAAAAPVWLYFDGSADAEKALQFGLQLCGANHSALKLIIPAATDKRFAALRQQAEALIHAASADHVLNESVQLKRRQQLPRLLREEPQSLLILARNSKLVANPQARNTLDEITGPVVLVS